MRFQPTLTEMKENILAILALTWGIIFFFPGDLLSQASAVDLLNYYAGDNTWGSLLVVGGLFVLFSPHHRYRHLRMAVHAFFWLFWLAMFILIVTRLARNGFSDSDMLLCSPFLTIALLHAAFYMRLAYSK